MFKKITKHLTNNIGLKLLSILFSIMLWLLVVNIADPDGTKTFSVPVNIQNKEVIERMGKVPDVVGDSDLAVFYITGPRSYVEEMDADDFNVIADLSQVDLTEEDKTKLVRIEVTPKKYEKYITVHQKTVNMQITLEELAEKNFIISPVTKGTPAEGFAIGNVEVTPNLLNVSGPQSIVSKISKVTANINVNGISGDVTDNVKPILYDEEGNIISSELLKMNQSSVNVKVNILGTRNLTIECDVAGEPAEGYEYKGLEYAPQTIMVKGEPEVLDSMNAVLTLEDVINIDGATSDVESTIDIILPEGVSLVDAEVNQIAVKALIVQKESKVFNLPTEDININGLSNDYELAYDLNMLPLTIRASQEDMGSFDIKSVQAKLNVEGLEPGTHTVQLEITVNSEKYEVVGTVDVQITIKNKSIETGADGENNNTGEGTETPSDGNDEEKPEDASTNKDSDDNNR